MGQNSIGAGDCLRWRLASDVARGSVHWGFRNASSLSQELLSGNCNLVVFMVFRPHQNVSCHGARLRLLRTSLNASSTEILDFGMRTPISDSTHPSSRRRFTYSPNMLCSGVSRVTLMPWRVQHVRAYLIMKVCSRSSPNSGSFFSIASRTALAKVSIRVCRSC